MGTATKTAIIYYLAHVRSYTLDRSQKKIITQVSKHGINSLNFNYFCELLKSKRINTDRVIFSQWSRKSYAIFASLKKVVSIGHLTIDICQSALLKNLTVIELLNLLGIEQEENDDYFTDELCENTLLSLATMPILNSTKDTYTPELYTSNNLGKPIFCTMQNMGFLFLRN